MWCQGFGGSNCNQLGGVQDNALWEVPRICVEVMWNPQTSGTSPKTRLPLLVAHCIWISTSSQQRIFLYCTVNCMRRLDSDEEARLSRSYGFPIEWLVTCLNSVLLVRGQCNHFRFGLSRLTMLSTSVTVLDFRRGLRFFSSQLLRIRTGARELCLRGLRV